MGQPSTRVGSFFCLLFSLWLKKFILCTLTCLICFSALLIFLMQMANTPLHVAASHNSVEVVKFLLNFARPETVDLEPKNRVHKILIQF